MRLPFHSTEVALARIVIPLSRSRSLLSKARSAIVWFSRNAPDVLTIHRLRLFSHDQRVQLLRYFLMSFIGPIQYFRATYIDFCRNTTR